MSFTPWLWPVLCALAVLLLLRAQTRGWPRWRVAAKLAASAAFLAWAWSLGAAQTALGPGLLVALALGALGDALLLGAGRAAFVGGLLAFLLGHAVFVAVFVQAGLDAAVLPATALAALALVGGVARWLWPWLPPALRLPVTAYFAVIAALLAVAAAHALAPPPTLRAGMAALGALAFAVSDLAVARDRFVHPDTPHRDARWGLPLYYAAQLLLAWGLVDAAGAGATLAA